MSELTERLWKLQNETSSLRKIEQALTNKPADFAEIDERYEAARRDIGLLEQALEGLQKDRRELERQLEVEQESLTRYQGQLMQVKNQQQYAAAWREIDTARKQVKEIEDAALQNMQQIEETEQKLASARSDLAPLEEEHGAAYEVWQSSLGDLREEQGEVRKRIGELEAKIPPNVVKEFRRIGDQRGGVAMARVVGSACEGCRVNVRPAVAQQLRRGELTRCEGCSRMLYMASEPVSAG